MVERHSALTVAAEICGPSTQAALLDGSAADGTGGAATAVDSKLHGEVAGFPFITEEIAEGTAAAGDGVCQHFLDRV